MLSGMDQWPVQEETLDGSRAFKSSFRRTQHVVPLTRKKPSKQERTPFDQGGDGAWRPNKPYCKKKLHPRRSLTDRRAFQPQRIAD